MTGSVSASLSLRPVAAPEDGRTPLKAYKTSRSGCLRFLGLVVMAFGCAAAGLRHGRAPFINPPPRVDGYGFSAKPPRENAPCEAANVSDPRAVRRVCTEQCHSTRR